MHVSALSHLRHIPATPSRAGAVRSQVPAQLARPAGLGFTRPARATGPIQALALPDIAVDPHAIAQGAAGVGLTVAAALVGVNKFRGHKPLRLRDLDAAAGTAAVLGTLVATHHVFVAHGTPGWLLPAAAMGIFGVASGKDEEEKAGGATLGTWGAWFLVACFEGLVNHGVPMAVALPLVLSYPSHMLAGLVPIIIERHRDGVD